MNIKPSFNEDIIPALLDLLRGAENSVHIAMAWLSHSELIHILEKKAAAGVAVWVVLNDDDLIPNKDIRYKGMVEAGAKIHYYRQEAGLMHHKFCVVDNIHTALGSFNWTYSADKKNKEDLLILRNMEDLAKTYSEIFNKLLANFATTTVTDIGISYQVTEWKYKIYLLEQNIAHKELAKKEMEHSIKDYEIEKWAKLHPYVVEKLRLEYLLAEKKYVLTQKNEEKQVWEEKRTAYQSYESRHTDEKKEEKTPYLGDDWKKMYREAMFMAHPDRHVNEPSKQKEAHYLVTALSDACHTGNKDKIKEIWLRLKNGTAFREDWLQSNDITTLENIYQGLIKKLHFLESEIRDLEAHEYFTILNKYPNVQSYFQELIDILKKNIEMLKVTVK